jgi:hypothetical protein
LHIIRFARFNALTANKEVAIAVQFWRIEQAWATAPKKFGTVTGHDAVLTRTVNTDLSRPGTHCQHPTTSVCAQQKPHRAEATTKGTVLKKETHHTGRHQQAA